MKLANAIKDQIITSLKPLEVEKIILFGSYAYGNPNEDSDLDICIIKSAFDSKIGEKRKIRAALKNIKMPKDILIAKIDEFEFYKNEINSVFSDINAKGVVLWKNS